MKTNYFHNLNTKSSTFLKHNNPHSLTTVFFILTQILYPRYRINPFPSLYSKDQFFAKQLKRQNFTIPKFKVQKILKKDNTFLPMVFFPNFQPNRVRGKKISEPPHQNFHFVKIKIQNFKRTKFSKVELLQLHNMNSQT